MGDATAVEEGDGKAAGDPPGAGVNVRTWPALSTSKPAATVTTVAQPARAMRRGSLGLIGLVDAPARCAEDVQVVVEAGYVDVAVVDHGGRGEPEAVWSVLPGLVDASDARGQCRSV